MSSSASSSSEESQELSLEHNIESLSSHSLTFDTTAIDYHVEVEQRVSEYLQQREMRNWFGVLDSEKLKPEERCAWESVRQVYSRFGVRSIFRKSIMKELGAFKSSLICKLVELGFLEETLNERGCPILTISH